MFGAESTPLLIIMSFVAGYFWGKHRITEHSNTFYRTSRLTQKQERILRTGLKNARTYIKTN